TDVAIFGLGNMFEVAEEAARHLREEGLSVALINPRFIKPLDGPCIERFAKTCRVLVTLEDHVVANGFGTGVLEHLCEANLFVPVIRVGWPDQFIDHGKQALLREQHGLTAEACVNRVLALLGNSPAQS
ncbi:MAG TPA: transketolase C-terminal domain-containing protein, partial [Verrucomicrobiales bacterium]|nr:transketolase C-terminal domain-containing protein [Verrucomicrobiales bacterium]